MSHDNRSQAGASGHSVPVASLVLKGQAQVRSPKAPDKGFHIGATRPRPAGRQDEYHREAHSGVTTRAFGRRRPPFVRIACTSCPLQIGRCGIPSRLIFGKRTGAAINRTSHHHRRQLNLDRIHSTKAILTSSPSSRTPLLRRLFFPCTCSSSAYEAIHHTTLE